MTKTKDTPAPTLPVGFRMETKMYIPFLDDEPIYKGKLFRWVKRPFRKSYHWKKVYTTTDSWEYEYAVKNVLIEYARNQLAVEATQK